MRLQLQSPHQDSLSWNLLLPCPLLDLHRRPPQMMRTLTNSTCLTNPARTTIQLRKKKKQPNPINPQDDGYISDFWGVCYPNKSPTVEWGNSLRFMYSNQAYTFWSAWTPYLLGSLPPTPLLLNRTVMMHTALPTPTKPTCTPFREFLAAYLS